MLFVPENARVTQILDEMHQTIPFGMIIRRSCVSETEKYHCAYQVVSMEHIIGMTVLHEKMLLALALDSRMVNSRHLAEEDYQGQDSTLRTLCKTASSSISNHF